MLVVAPRDLLAAIQAEFPAEQPAEDVSEGDVARALRRGQGVRVAVSPQGDRLSPRAAS